MTLIKIYVPQVIKDLSYMTYEETETLKKIERFKAMLIGEFGGLTVYPDCVGYWKNSHNSIETETVNVFEILTENSNLEEIEAILTSECRALKRDLKQNSVLFSINNKPFFV
jgi:hypothetical protein